MKFNLTAHKELWNWLAENPDKEKREWPGWGENGGKYREVNALCFACEYDTNVVDETGGCQCDKCPLLWGAIVCYICPSPYVERRSLHKNENKKNRRSELARQIANLPVREGVECE